MEFPGGRFILQPVEQMVIILLFVSICLIHALQTSRYAIADLCSDVLAEYDIAELETSAFSFIIYCFAIWTSTRIAKILYSVQSK